MQAESRVDAYTMPLDAELAKAYLESHEIRVRLEGETLGGTAYALGPMMGGIRLYVDEHEERRARALLDDYHRVLHERRQVSYGDDDQDEFDDEVSEPHAEQERASSRGTVAHQHELTVAADDSATHAWVAALAGLVLFPVIMHAYSMVCLLGTDRRHLTARGRRRYLAAWFVDGGAILIASWVIWWLMVG